MHNEQLRDKEPIFPTPIADMEFIRRSQDEQLKQIMKDHALAFFAAGADWDASQTPEQFYDEWMLSKG